MKKKELSVSETSVNGDSSSDEEPKTPEKATTVYEKQRQLRIAENKARMELLGLHKIANSLMGSNQSSSRETRSKSKSKGDVMKVEEDDDYRPFDDDDDDDLSSSSEELVDESVYGRKSRSCSGKVKKSISRKQVSKKRSVDIPDIKDEDEALMQAIALSLKDSGEISDLPHCGSSQGPNPHAASINKKGHGHIQEESTKRKKKKLSSRVQMTEDDLVIHFCQLDEAGNESISLRDVQRMAATHDFTWTDKELADMIHCFDTDRDGKLTLDDFRNIAARCNMLQGPQNP